MNRGPGLHRDEGGRAVRAERGWKRVGGAHVGNCPRGVVSRECRCTLNVLRHQTAINKHETKHTKPGHFQRKTQRKHMRDARQIGLSRGLA